MYSSKKKNSKKKRGVGVEREIKSSVRSRYPDPPIYIYTKGILYCEVLSIYFLGHEPPPKK